MAFTQPWIQCQGKRMSRVGDRLKTHLIFEIVLLVGLLHELPHGCALGVGRLPQLARPLLSVVLHFAIERPPILFQRKKRSRKARLRIPWVGRWSKIFMRSYLETPEKAILAGPARLSNANKCGALVLLAKSGPWISRNRILLAASAISACHNTKKKKGPRHIGHS